MNRTHDLKSSCSSSDEEDDELLFPFEPEEDEEVFAPRLHSQGSDIFHPIDGVDIERPGNPLVAILEYQEAVDSRQHEPHETTQVAVTPVPKSRKRKTLHLPNAPAQIIRPVAKRLKASVYERGVIVPASLMGSLSLDRTRDCCPQQRGNVCQLVENKTDTANAPFRSASIKIPSRFQPILWPGDAHLVSPCTERDGSQSCSSSSSSKSWTSGLELACRRSLDVSSPVCECFNDLALHSSTGSYKGS